MCVIIFTTSVSEDSSLPAKPRPRIRKILPFLVPGAAFSLLLLTVFLDRWGQHDRLQKADAIIVLGARVLPGGVAGPSLNGRALQAAQLYVSGWAPRIITTGGIGENPPAESVVAAKILENEGVPSRAILREETSTSTWENATNAAEICRSHGWKRVIVVSEPFHLFRAQRNFRHCGLEAFTSPSQNRSWPQRLEMTLRESILVLRDFILRPK